MSFKNLNLVTPILKALQEAGYHSPTPIQAESIPHLLQGKDFLGCAQTGTGKTAAFALPILQRLYTDKQDFSPNSQARIPKPPKALILSPTRELAAQIGDSFNIYGKYSGVKSCVIFGGVSQNAQTDALKKNPDILIATPGRLLDLMHQNFVTLKHVEIFVLDEADQMLDMGFIHDIKKIMGQLPEKRQNMLFSATMPLEIQKLVESFLKDPIKVSVTPIASTVASIEQYVYFTEKMEKRKLLAQLLKDENISSALVFSRTKHGADRITRDLNRAGFSVQAIHGDKSQYARQVALNNFKNGKNRVLVATDIAARGIDVSELSHVINFDLPNISETYVHRIGRTGRAGLGGVAISFCASDEKSYLKSIQKLIGKSLEVKHAPLPKDDIEIPLQVTPAKPKGSVSHVRIRKKNSAAHIQKKSRAQS